MLPKHHTICSAFVVTHNTVTCQEQDSQTPCCTYAVLNASALASVAARYPPSLLVPAKIGAVNSICVCCRKWTYPVHAHEANAHYKERQHAYSFDRHKKHKLHVIK